jgi:hypothetical protein
VFALVGCATDESTTSEDLEGVQLAGVESESLLGDLIKLGFATAKYHDPEKAQADGWDLIPGLDHCFNNQPQGAMGYHYINAAKLDNTVENFKPEAMVYHTDRRGQLRFGAVEYIVPAAGWDAAHPGEHPMALGQHMHLNAALGVYVLHVWLWKNNPDGLFSDWNPRVTCP